MNLGYKYPKGTEDKMASKETAMDHKLCMEISEYVEELTTSGKLDLNKDTMKKLKNICKQSDAYVNYTYDLVMTQLGKHHSEIRISAFQITDELFNRSHAFRELLLADFQDFMDLTIEANPEFSLPPPKAAAKKLKTCALDSIHKWNVKYGNDYKKISLGYNYLKNCKKMDFSGTNVRTQAEQRRTDEQQQRQDMMRKQRLENVLKEMSENSLDIKGVLIQIENSLKLLLPDPDSFQIHGLMSPEHRPSYHNPFLSYAKRTPAEITASRRSVRKTSDPSKIKGRRGSRKSIESVTPASPPVKIKEEPKDQSSEISSPKPAEIKQERSSSIEEETGPKGSKTRGKRKTDDSVTKQTTPNTTTNNKSKTDNSVTKQTTTTTTTNNKSKTDDSVTKQTTPNTTTNSKSKTDNSVTKQTTTTTTTTNKSKTDDSVTKQTTPNTTTNSKSKTDDSITKRNDTSIKGTTNNKSKTSENLPSESPDPSNTRDQTQSTSIKKEPEPISSSEPRGAESGNEEFEEISTPSGSEEDEDFDDTVSEADVVRDHGLMSQLYRMQVEIRPEDLSIRESEDNTDILRALREFARQVAHKFMPQVQRWLEVLSKTGAEQSQIQKAIDIKNALELAKKRTTSFKVIPMARKQEKQEQQESADTDDDEDDFEDVPSKAGYEDDIPSHLKEPTVPKVPKQATARDWTFPHVNMKRRHSESEELDPTTPQATLRKLMKGRQIDVKPESSPIKTRPLEKAGSSSGQGDTKAPVIPFGVDLLHWGQKVDAPLLVRHDSDSHRFWNAPPDTEDVIDKAALAQRHSRTINFTGNFEPVKWSCRAPLQNGTLCPRKDRYKCPFHGKIIGRDNMGRPSKVEDAQRLAEEEIKKRKDQPAEWEDADLQAEIEAATGVSLNPSGSKGKGQKKGRRRKYQGLTNINKLNPKTKLQKKILNPRALRRVEDKIANINIKRHNDKFGNNYNYARNQMV